jgi:hypothetical protein
MSNHDDVHRVAQAALRGAAAAFEGRSFVVVVVVREVPAGQLTVAANIIGDRAAAARVLRDGAHILEADRPGGLVLPS